jgi:hypothetical protein
MSEVTTLCSDPRHNLAVACDGICCSCFLEEPLLSVSDIRKAHEELKAVSLSSCASCHESIAAESQASFVLESDGSVKLFCLACVSRRARPLYEGQTEFYVIVGAHAGSRIRVFYPSPGQDETGTYWGVSRAYDVISSGDTQELIPVEVAARVTTEEFQQIHGGPCLILTKEIDRLQP